MRKRTKAKSKATAPKRRMTIKDAAWALASFSLKHHYLVSECAADDDDYHVEITLCVSRDEVGKARDGVHPEQKALEALLRGKP